MVKYWLIFRKVRVISEVEIEICIIIKVIWSEIGFLYVECFEWLRVNGIFVKVVVKRLVIVRLDIKIL